MPTVQYDNPLLLLSLFIVALLYSAVGHGGASGYLGVMSLLAINPDFLASTALLLNVIVATIAAARFSFAGHLRLNRTWQFLIGSVPAAYLGANLHLPREVYSLLLSGVLLWAAGLMWIRSRTSDDELEQASTTFSMAKSVLAGAIIGILSGMVGVGGGIFLSPLIIANSWLSAKQTSATSAVFIVFNSLSGLFGKWQAGTLAIEGSTYMIFACVLGGISGSTAGAKRLSNNTLKRVLSIVLVIAASKLLLILFHSR